MVWLERLWALRKVSRTGVGTGAGGGARGRGRIGGMPSVKSGTGSGGSVGLSDVGLLREYATHLRVEKGLRPLSVEAYQRDLESLRSLWRARTRTLVTARQEDVSGFMEAPARACDGVAESMARKLSCLRGFYRWLLMDKRIKHDPTVNIESPSSWKVLPKTSGRE